MIILNKNQLFGLRGGSDKTRILRPRALADGTYAVNENVKNDSAHIGKLSTLNAGSIREPNSGEYLASPNFEVVYVDGKRMKINAADTAWSVLSPSPDRYRFELRSDDVGDPADPLYQRHRSELVGRENEYSAGTDIWWSFAIRVLGDQSWRTESPSVIVGQWHSVDTDETGSRAPCLTLQFTSGNEMYVATRSDAEYEAGRTGLTKKRWQGGIPDPDVWVRFVIRARYGASGQLDVYKDGQLVTSLTGIPIGYYNDTGALGYMQFGIYRLWRNNNMIVEYANMEWGTESLLDRVLTPLPI